MAEKISIILPTYNERENLPLILGLIHKHLKGAKLDYEVIIVDDNSPDGTQDIARELEKKYGHNHIILAPRPGKLGLGSAYKHGLTKCSGTYVVLMDADLSHHPKFIPQMFKLMQDKNYDIITGTRYNCKEPGETGVYGWNLKRKVVSTGANYLATVILRPSVSDLTGSFRLYRREVFDALLATGMPKGYAFQMGIAVKAQDLGYRIGEVPISFVDRLYGESKLGMKEVTQYVEALQQFFMYNPVNLPNRKHTQVARTRSRAFDFAILVSLLLVIYAALIYFFIDSALCVIVGYPLLFVALFGIHSAGSLILGVARFPTCKKHVYEELTEEIKEFQK